MWERGNSCFVVHCVCHCLARNTLILDIAICIIECLLFIALWFALMYVDRGYKFLISVCASFYDGRESYLEALSV